MVTKEKNQSGNSNISRNSSEITFCITRASYLKDENDSRARCLKYWLERRGINPNYSILVEVNSFSVYVVAGEKNIYMFYVSYGFLKIFRILADESF